jgi:hypothetical protein
MAVERAKKRAASIYTLVSNQLGDRLMATDWNFIPGLITAVSGLGGVWLGGWLASRRDVMREHERIKKESSYLAILVLAHLDRFANGCMQVAFDDGTREGRPVGGDGEYCSVTVTPPSFDPLGLNVDWKVLPSDLMYEILGLPYKAEQLSSHINGVLEFDDPPDYAEFFEARQYGYAVLGLEVSAIAFHLRKHAGLPIVPSIEGEWNRDDELKKIRDKIERDRSEYQARITTRNAIFEI